MEPLLGYSDVKKLAVEHQREQDAMLAQEMPAEVKEQLQAAISEEDVELACEFEAEYRARSEASKAAAAVQAVIRGRGARAQTEAVRRASRSSAE